MTIFFAVALMTLSLGVSSDEHHAGQRYRAHPEIGANPWSDRS
jgi:hypothetical protein